MSDEQAIADARSLLSLIDEQRALITRLQNLVKQADDELGLLQREGLLKATNRINTARAHLTKALEVF